MSQLNKVSAKKPLRSIAPNNMRLEQRLMFDGAVAETVVETIPLASEPTPTETAISNTPPALEEIATESNIISSSEADNNSALDEASELAQQNLITWFNSADYFVQAADIFSADADSDQWKSNALELQENFLNGQYSIQVKSLDSEALTGALAGYSSTGTDGIATIYLNQTWLSTATPEAIQSVLLEEIGHDFDQILNDGVDTTGDEGHNFASYILYGPDNASIQNSDDKIDIEIDGQLITIEQAGPFTINQINYVPLDEADLTTALNAIDNAGNANGIITTTVAIAPTEDGTVVVYDHWEDGYEADISNPLQASTEIWGDGDLTNGVAPGTADDLIIKGQSLVLQNDVDTATPVANDYDARDKIASTKAVSVTRAAWDTGIGTFIAGGVNIQDASNAGTDFIIPIGEQIPPAGGSWDLFEYTSLHIIAYTNGTSIDIDSDGDGGVDTTIVLNEGETHFINGGILAGATVSASEKIGVYTISGNIDIQGSRWFTIPSTDQWSNSYYAPVAETEVGTDVRIFIYNPGPAITIDYETLDGSGNPTTTSIGVAASSFETFSMPASAAYISSSGGEDFFAVSTIDDLLVADWAYNLIPEDSLSSNLVVPWGPGNTQFTNLSGFSNETPVWVTASRDTELYVDSATALVMSADGTVIAGTMVDADTYSYSVTRLESYRVFDSGDNDQTNLNVYTTDGTLISAAWGADPDDSYKTGNLLDMGYALMPFPEYKVLKTSVESGGDGDGIVELGEQISYSITVTNSLLTPLDNINFTDELPDTDIATYVPGSTTLTVYDASNNIIYQDTDLDGASDIFPLSGAGYTLTDTNSGLAGDQGLELGERAVVTYKVQIRDTVNQALIDAGFSLDTTSSLGGDESGNAIASKASLTSVAIAIPATATIEIVDENSTDSGDISVAENSSVGSKTFSVYPLNNVTSLLIEGNEIVGGTYPIAIATTLGTLTVTDYAPTTGVVTYSYDPNGSSQDHSSGEVLETININITDNTAATDSATLDILITDTIPTANADTVSIEEDTTSFSDNVIAGTLSDDTIVDTPATVVGLAIGNTGTNLSNPATIDVALVGSYGSFEISSDGSFTYTLNTSDVAVQALTRGSNLNDLFSYTISDSDGDQSNALVTVIINGVDEPVVSAIDTNGLTSGDITIVESSSGISSYFIAQALDGLNTLNISGTDITLPQLLNASSTPISVTSSLGTITITGYDNTTGVTNYSYSLLSPPIDHSSGSILDVFTITTTDDNARVASDDLDIFIEDTAPDAAPDSNSIDETSASGFITGNLITGISLADTPSFDGGTEVAGLAAGHTTSTLDDVSTVASPVLGTYGSLEVQSDGSYVYTLDQTNPVVTSLHDGMSLLDSFTYTITDTDGTLDYSTVGITIVGIDIPPTVASSEAITTIPLDENGGIQGNSYIVNAEEGLASVEINGVIFTPTELIALNTTPNIIDTGLGELTITGYDTTSGAIFYNYSPYLGAAGVDGNMQETLTFTVTDVLGYTATSAFNVNLLPAVYSDPLNDEQPTSENVLQKLSGQEAFRYFNQVNSGSIASTPTITPDIDTLLFGADIDESVLDTRPNSARPTVFSENLAIGHELVVSQLCQANWLDRLSELVESDLSELENELEEENELNQSDGSLTDGQLLSDHEKLLACQQNWLSKLGESADSDVARLISDEDADYASSEASQREEDENSLRVQKTIPIQSVISGDSIEYTVPIDTFIHSDSTAEVTLVANMLDGSEIPEWLSFNPSSGEFTGVPPAEFSGELQIYVIARDEVGRQAETILSIKINSEDQAGLQSKTSLSDQLNSQNVFAWKSSQDVQIADSTQNQLLPSSTLRQGS